MDCKDCPCPHEDCNSDNCMEVQVGNLPRLISEDDPREER